MPRDLVGGAGARLKSSLIPMNRPFRRNMRPQRTLARPLPPAMTYKEVILPISFEQWDQHAVTLSHLCTFARDSAVVAPLQCLFLKSTCPRALESSISVPSSDGLRRPYTLYSILYTLVALTARHSRGRALFRGCRARGRQTPDAPARGGTASRGLPSRRRSA